MTKLVISDIEPPRFGAFGEADEAWLPRYVDVLSQYDTAKYGFDALEIDEQYVTLLASRSRIKQLFEGRYMYRRISAEGLVRWQTRLQLRMDELCARYDREMALYAKVTVDNAVTGGTVTTVERTESPDLTDSVTYGSKTEVKGNGGTLLDVTDSSRTTADSGTDTVTGRTIDTPQSSINASDSYADSLQEDKTEHGLTVSEDVGESTTHTDNRDETTDRSGTDTTRRSGSTTVSETVSVDDTPEGGLMIATKEACDAWEDLCVRLVSEFENLFLNVFDY